MEYPVISEERAGIFLAGGNSRTAHEMSDAIITEAIAHGHVIDYDEAVAWSGLVWSTGRTQWATFPDTDEEDPGGDAGQFLTDLHVEALNFLNEVAPFGYVFELDGDLDLLPMCETDSFEPRWHDCPHGEECLTRVRRG